MCTKVDISRNDLNIYHLTLNHDLYAMYKLHRRYNLPLVAKKLIKT